MIYLTKEQLAFIHIPKCGGTSVLNQIRKLPKYKWNIKYGTHSGCDVAEDFNNFIVQVRNPYERFLSAYHHQMYRGQNLSLHTILNYLKNDNAHFFTDYGILRRQCEWIDFKKTKIFKLEEGTIWTYLNDLGYDINEKHSKPQKRTISLTDEQKKIVYKYYKTDFERLGYNE